MINYYCPRRPKSNLGKISKIKVRDNRSLSYIFKRRSISNFDKSKIFLQKNETSQKFTVNPYATLIDRSKNHQIFKSWHPEQKFRYHMTQNSILKNMRTKFDVGHAKNGVYLNIFTIKIDRENQTRTTLLFVEA